MNTAVEIAGYFLEEGQEDSSKTRIIYNKSKLQKMVYLANGYSLAILKKPLVNDQFYAFHTGPVEKNLYRTFNKVDSVDLRHIELIPKGKFNEKEVELLGKVVNTFGILSSTRLEEITNKKKSPWGFVWKSNPFGLIPESILEDYFTMVQRKG